MRVKGQPLLSTIRELCGMCYTCVRECPAKAIQVSEGQASVLTDHCIGCGNCLRVCSRKAKQVLSSVAAVQTILRCKTPDSPPIVALFAPSFPVEFPAGMGPVIQKLRAMGFDAVQEISFAADLVAHRYAEILARSSQPSEGHYIATTCPAVVSFVERYAPEQVSRLIPVVSPMIAGARIAKRIYGPKCQTVFIGPCIAKKSEADHEEVRGDIDEVLTFRELRELMALAPPPESPTKTESLNATFDPPLGGYGSLFPISHGLLKAAGIHEDILQGDVDPQFLSRWDEPAKRCGRCLPHLVVGDDRSSGIPGDFAGACHHENRLRAKP